MARLPRFALPGLPQHIIQRGNNRQVIFRTKNDYQFYVEKLSEAAKKHQCDIHAYVLMPNHVHLLATPHTKDGMGKMMQTLGRYYVQYYNHRYKRTGTLWEGRYKATLVDTEQYFLTCMRYIELNPVRANGLVDHPSKYPWSSYGCNANGQTDALVTAHSEYIQMGKTKIERQTTYRQLFRTRIPDTTLETIRESTNKAWVLGGRQFKSKIEAKLNRPAQSAGQGGDRKSETYKQMKKSRSLTP